MLNVSGSLTTVSNVGLDFRPRIISVINNHSSTYLEGETIQVDFVLETGTVKPTTYYYNVTGTVAPIDYGTVSFSSNVTDNLDGTITVDTNSSSFQMEIPLVWDELLENDETIIITIRGLVTLEYTVKNLASTLTYFGRISHSAPYQWFKLTDTGTLIEDFSNNSRYGTFSNGNNDGHLPPPTGVDGVTESRFEGFTGNLPANLWNNDTTLEFFYKFGEPATVDQVTPILKIGNSYDVGEYKISLDLDGSTTAPKLKLSYYDDSQVLHEISEYIPYISDVSTEWFRIRLITSGQNIIVKMALQSNWDSWFKLMQTTYTTINTFGDEVNTGTSVKFYDVAQKNTAPVNNYAWPSVANMILWAEEIGDNQVYVDTNTNIVPIASLTNINVGNLILEGDEATFEVVLQTTTVQDAYYQLSFDGSTITDDDISQIYLTGAGTEIYGRTMFVPAGTSSFYINVVTATDMNMEGNETLTININVDQLSSLCVVADLVVPMVTSISDDSQFEGTPLTHTVTLSSATQVTTYKVISSDELGDSEFSQCTYTNGVTYENYVLTIPASVSTFDILYTYDDEYASGDWSYVITIDDSTGTGTVYDNDTPPSVISVSNASNVDGAAITHEVVISNATNSEAVFPFVITPNSAVAGSDYNASATFTSGVTLNAGNIHVPYNVTSFYVSVSTILDTEHENDETYTITVGGMSGIGTIIDDDAPRVTSITDGSNNEGGYVPHTVKLDKLHNGITLSYSIVGSSPTIPNSGTATGGNNLIQGIDFKQFYLLTTTGWHNGNLVSYNVTADANTVYVPAGVTEFTVSVQTYNDTLYETEYEEYTITVGGASATGFIISRDDPAPSNYEISVLNSGVSQWLRISTDTHLTATDRRALDSSGNNRLGTWASTTDMTSPFAFSPYDASVSNVAGISKAARTPINTNISLSDFIGGYATFEYFDFYHGASIGFLPYYPSFNIGSAYRKSGTSMTNDQVLVIDNGISNDKVLRYRDANNVTYNVSIPRGTLPPSYSQSPLTWSRIRILLSPNNITIKRADNSNWNNWVQVANVNHIGLYSLTSATVRTGGISTTDTTHSNGNRTDFKYWNRLLNDNEAMVYST